MSRILFTSTLGTSGWAGSEVLWFQGASLLAGMGNEVAAILPHSMKTSANAIRLNENGIQNMTAWGNRGRGLAVRLGRRISPAKPSRVASVVNQARRWKADVVVLSQASCWGGYSEMLALAEAKIPYVCISQLNTPFSWPGDGLFEAIGDAFSKAEAAVFVSQGNLNLLENQIARKLENAQVIYNPPSFDVSSPCGPPPEDAFRLLNVARIDPGHKGQDLLLDVLSMPKWRERKVELRIAGGGHRQWIERLIDSKGLSDVTVLGHVKDLKREWDQATFGVFPSRYEGMPLAMIEGMALGRAVIATDVAGHGEWISDGSNGFLAEGVGVMSLERALDRAWEKRGRADDLGGAARVAFETQMPEEPSEAFVRLIEASV